MELLFLLAGIAVIAIVIFRKSHKIVEKTASVDAKPTWQETTIKNLEVAKQFETATVSVQEPEQTKADPVVETVVVAAQEPVKKRRGPKPRTEDKKKPATSKRAGAKRKSNKN